MSIQEWRTTVYRVSYWHLSQVWLHDADPSTGREPSAELDAAIDSFIADTFAQFARTSKKASK